MRDWLLQRTRLTPNGAWLLGYLWSDGCVNLGQNRLSFECKLEDRELLDQIKKIVQCVHTVRELKPRLIEGRVYKGAKLQIYSKKLAREAISWGVVPHRGKFNYPFPDIDGRYLHHFLRGVLDGDGCVSIQNCADCAYPMVKVYWVGSLAFIEVLREKVNNYLRILDGGRARKSKGVVYVQWAARKHVRKLYAWLYPTDNVPCLLRKRLKMKEVFES